MGEACEECKRNCQLIHLKKKDPSASVTTFFKIMMGDDFSRVLLLPPRFALTVSNLVDKEIHLEDSAGKMWRVKLCRDKDSLVFRNGWDKFSSDHGITMGDFLVFYYNMESHFVVHIYGKSGCLKQNFPRTRNRQKRIKTNGNASNERQLMPVADTSKFNNGSVGQQVVPTTRCNEEPIHIIDRDAEYNQGEDQRCLDLADFELPKNTSETDGANKMNKRSNQAANSSLQDKDPLFVEVLSIAVPPEVNDSVMQRKDIDSQKVDNPALMSPKDFDCGPSAEPFLSAADPAQDNNENMTVISCCNADQRSTSYSSNGCSLTSHVEETAVTALPVCSPVSAPVLDFQSGKEPSIFQDCHHSSSLAAKRIVKTEPVDPSDSLPVKCLVYRELSESLMLMSSRKARQDNKNSRRSQKVVLLRGPNSAALWPVFYHEYYGLFVLTNGWESFAKANGIGSDNECAFELENDRECIYRVSIKPKLMQLSFCA